MKRYNITVNGKTYSVDVEEVDLRKNKSKASQPIPDLDPIEIPSSDIEIEKKEFVNSPLAGTVSQINKNVGDKVSYGETLVIISSDDKLNDIGAPKDGVISEILVKPNDIVEVDTVLVIIN